jgi:hypothetical protein
VVRGNVSQGPFYSGLTRVGTRKTRQTREGCTYIVVLDGKKNKAIGVFLEKRLMCLLFLDGRRDTSLCYRLLFWEVWDADDGLENVFLIR